MIRSVANRTEKAPAKVNLTLHVGPPRADGRHPLRSLTVFAATVADTLRLEPDGVPTLTLGGPMAGALELAGEAAGDNLVLRAQGALAARLGRAAVGRFHLDKEIPVAAGLGGGSADAGAALRLLAREWGVEDQGLLLGVAAGLGGDVPAAFLSRPVMMEGEGEIVRPLDGLAVLYGVLVNPGVACPTGPVFRELDRLKGWQVGACAGDDMSWASDDAPPLRDAGALMDWVAAGRNDLEAPACGLVPEIGAVLRACREAGARIARVSGSGASVLGLWDTGAQARAAAGQLAAARAGWWVRATDLGMGL